MKLKLKLLFLCMFNVQAQTAKKVLLTTATNNLKLQRWHFVTFTTTKGDITVRIERGNNYRCQFHCLLAGVIITDDKLKETFLMV
jgi:hypothetical protein